MIAIMVELPHEEARVVQQHINDISSRKCGREACSIIREILPMFIARLFSNDRGEVETTAAMLRSQVKEAIRARAWPPGDKKHPMRATVASLLAIVAIAERVITKKALERARKAN